MLSRSGTERSRLSDPQDDLSPLQTQQARSSIDSRDSRNQIVKQYSFREGRSFQKGPVPREDTYPSDLYDMYSSRPSRQFGSQRGFRLSREEDENDSDYEGDSIDGSEFEMISVRAPRGPNSISGNSVRRSSRRSEIHKIRIKVHHEDARYIMVDATIEYLELITRIQDKFGLRGRFKIKVREEDVPNGDMITMGDQDDLDMIIMAAKSTAKKERADVGKMEVS